MKDNKKLIQSLMDNTRWNFWTKDWTKRIIVDWDGKLPLNKFRRQVEKLVGEGFIYERSLNEDPTNYIVTKTGLIPAIITK